MDYFNVPNALTSRAWVSTCPIQKLHQGRQIAYCIREVCVALLKSNVYICQGGVTLL